MSARYRIPLALLAFLAMFATMMPQSVWACPMTGRIGSAEYVCGGKMQTADGKPCAMAGGKCCKPLTVPPSSDDDDSHRPHVFSSTGHGFELAGFVQPSFEPQVAIIAAPIALQVEPEAVRVYLSRFTNSPPSWWTQYRPITLAGRAPPVL